MLKTEPVLTTGVLFEGIRTRAAGVGFYPFARYSSSGFIMHEGRYFKVGYFYAPFIVVDPVGRPVLFSVSPVRLIYVFSVG